MKYNIFVNGKLFEMRDSPFTQKELREYMTNANLRMKGMDFSGDTTIYHFEKIHRRASSVSDGYGWGV